jgi:hypothetical protein
MESEPERREEDVEASRESCSFYVAGVPPVVFNEDPEISIRPEFESIFRGFCEDVKFLYLKSFGRVRVTYPDPEQRLVAWSSLREQEFRGSNLHLRPVTAVLIGSKQLELPKKMRNFLISPPASPPVGWEQSQEAPPTMLNYKLVSALASLQLPGEVQELHEATDSTPGIVVVTPDDTDHTPPVPSVCLETDTEPRTNIDYLPRHFVQTARPPFCSS